MKSSSDLFPVTLVSAELRAAWSEDLYRLKPNNSADHSVEFSVVRCSRSNGSAGSRPTQPPVLWLPHFLTSRLDWQERWEEIVPQLLDAGTEVWYLEWRGQGASPANADWARNRLLDLAAFDLPAAIAFVAEQTGQAPLVLAERSAAQVWVAAHGALATEAAATELGVRGSLLLWPVLGPVPVPEYARAMRWEDRDLEVSRHAVRGRNHMESVNRILFDELLFGQRHLLRRWQAAATPARFTVVEEKRFEKPTHRWLNSLPGSPGRSRFFSHSELDAALLKRWLDELAGA